MLFNDLGAFLTKWDIFIEERALRLYFVFELLIPSYFDKHFMLSNLPSQVFTISYSF